MTQVTEPFRLSRGPHLFVDWRYVRAGFVQWVSRDNKPYTLWGTEADIGPRDAYPVPKDVPRGIRIVAQRAQKSEPFLTSTRPWEHMLYCYSTLMYESGYYHLWYEVVNPERVDLLCYAKSKDGFSWEKPPLGIVKYRGEDTNIVFGGNLCSETGFHGSGVFLDPSASADERYKIVFLGKNGVYGAVSNDGLHWKAIPDPLALHISDTGNAAYYDPTLKRYVWYCRMWLYGRRYVGRAETEDFRSFQKPEAIIWPGSENLPSDDWYTNSHAIYPGTSDQHFMFPALYHRAIDSAELHMYSSSGGVVWSRVPGGSVLSPGPPGSWDCGYVFGGCGLASLPDNRIGLPYMGFPVPHKYPRSRPMGAIAYAWWPKGRLAALETTEEGQFSTPKLVFEGRNLLLNVQTERAGYVLVEAADERGQSFPGRSFKDADPVSGDAFEYPVTWKGEDDLGFMADHPVVFRFALRAAKLFAFEFV